jgi:hypothetical protein
MAANDRRKRAQGLVHRARVRKILKNVGIDGHEPPLAIPGRKRAAIPLRAITPHRFAPERAALPLVTKRSARVGVFPAVFE